MINLDIPNHIRDIFYQKRVAIVGPAAYLTGMGNGKLIDDYDIIVRPNYFSLPLTMHKDYGSRTDVMYHNMASYYLPGLIEHIDNNQRDFESLKLVIGSAIKAGPQDNNWTSWPNHHISECATNFDKLKISSVLYWWIGVSNYKLTFQEIGGCEPYTGISSILITTLCQPAEIYLTGFDFHTGSKLYVDGYLASMDKNQEQTNRNGGHGSECTKKNKDYVKRWYEHCKFANTDQHILELIK